MKKARIFAIFAGATALLLVRCMPAAAMDPVDLELVLATDVSRSIDPIEARLQREGVASAFMSDELARAISAGALGKIAVAYVDFSSRAYNVIVVDWMTIDGPESAKAFASKLLSAPPSYGRHTSVSDAIELAASLIEINDYAGTRLVIDVSGDGPNNYGRLVSNVRDDTVAKGIVINALPIMNDSGFYDFQRLPDLDRYFAGCVIGGPGAFVMVAKDFSDFARAIRNKLFREIAGVPGAPWETADVAPRLIKVSSRYAQLSGTVPGAAAPHTAYEHGCDIGERMRGGWYGGGFPDSFQPRQ